MNAAHAAPPETAADTHQVLRAALCDLLQMGLRVAEASTRLAEIETQAADALAKAAIRATAIVERQDSLDAATEIGQIADASEAARDMAATRLALITRTFEVASRAVRRTVALALRAEEPRPARSAPGSPPDGPAQPRETAVRASEDLSERLDPPEVDDETGDKPDAVVLVDIRRDLRRAAQSMPDPLPPPRAPVRPRPKPANDAPGLQSLATLPPRVPKPDT